jgi:hypothetical protein
MAIVLQTTEILTSVTETDKVHVVNQGSTLLFRSETGQTFFTLSVSEETDLETRLKRWRETGSFELGA